MHGTGVPIVTPFDEEGGIDHDRLRDLVRWLETAGVDFLVPCGSNGESELLSVEERAAVVETVVDEASVPVLAGTGHPGFAETHRQTALAAESGADAALVITPFYYQHDQEALARYYRRVAEDSDIPVYLYSVPGKSGVSLDPATVAELSKHDNIHGMKDSSGNLVILTQERRRSEDDFELFIGTGSLYAQGLDIGTEGGVLALANVAPEKTAEIYRLHRAGKPSEARSLNGDLVDLNQAITARYGVPGVKAAMRARDVPAGTVRSPFEPLAGEDLAAVEELVAAVFDE